MGHREIKLSLPFEIVYIYLIWPIDLPKDILFLIFERVLHPWKPRKMHFSEANLEIVKHLLWYLKTVSYSGKKLQLRLNLTRFWIRICFHIMFWKVANYSKPKKGCKIQSMKKLHLGLANFTSEKIYVQMVNNGEQCLGMFIKNIVDCHWTFLHFVKAKYKMNKIFPWPIFHLVT